MEDHPDEDPPVIMVATDAVALYPSLKKYETARRIRKFIEKSDVNFEGVDVTEALVYLRLNEHILKKQKSFEEVKGFLPIPKNGREKHMTHPTVKGPHAIKELKELDTNNDDNNKKNDRNPWILKDEPENP